jgi:hypothetical protein
MLIITIMKAFRDVWVETFELRRTLAKRYPFAGRE